MRHLHVKANKCIGLSHGNESHRIWLPPNKTHRAAYAESNSLTFAKGEPLMPNIATGIEPLEAPGYVGSYGYELDNDAVVVGN